MIGLHSARMLQHRLEPTANFLMQTMGFRWIGEEHGWHRYALGQGQSGQLLEIRADSSEHNGRLGKGVIHHLAWRVADDAAELAVRARLALAQRQPTPVIDRFWFKSVYFREPGGAVFEIATDGPGFAVDEPNETLGERLMLPPWLEIRRSEIEGVLPKLKMPTVKPFE